MSDAPPPSQATPRAHVSTQGTGLSSGGLSKLGRPARGFMAADAIAIVLTMVWLLGVGIYFLAFRPQGQDGTQLGFAVSAIAIGMPIVLIWLGAMVTKTARIMRDEAERLQHALDALRNAYVSQGQTAATTRPAMEQKLDEIVARQKQAEKALADFASSVDTTVPQAAAEQPALAQPAAIEASVQPSLALGSAPQEAQQALTIADFIGALDFPENEDDVEGFRQLRRALSDPNSSSLIRASQDVLTLLSQDGIYMDDLTPDRSRPTLWRQFAEGQRGIEVSGIGGIHDRSALALAAGRMRSDPVFRDAVHHFLRQFDRTLSKFSQVATDQDITRFADTRTSRAFMLLARVAGTFD